MTPSSSRTAERGARPGAGDSTSASAARDGRSATTFGEAVVGVLYGKGEPKALLDAAAAKMDQILKD